MKRNRQEETRTWCSICNLWIADNRVQREQHESGTRHKTAYAKLIKDISKRNDERRAAGKALAATRTAPSDTSPSKTGSVHQLLEHAVSSAGGAQLNGQQQNKQVAKKCDVAEATQETAHKETTVTAVTEQTDENGYPLAAASTYGTWIPVTYDNADEHGEQVTSQDTKTCATTSANASELATPILSDEKQLNAVEVTFKKRVHATSKRKRRKRD